MSNEEEIKEGDADFRFLMLVMSLVSAAWSQLGKIPHPQTQKLEKDLKQAVVTIDFLRMLLEKTDGNRTPKEDEMLRNAVSDLELNFADGKKDQGASTSGGPSIIIPEGAGNPNPGIIRPN